MSKTKDEVRPIRLFKCSCKNENEFEFEDFKKHLAEEHNMSSAEDLKGTKQMICHIDGANFYQYTFQWTLNNGHFFTEFIQKPRLKSEFF